jgi:hypothetical protein
VSTVTNQADLVSPSEAFPLVNIGDPLETKTILAKIAVKRDTWKEQRKYHKLTIRRM